MTKCQDTCLVPDSKSDNTSSCTISQSFDIEIGCHIVNFALKFGMWLRSLQRRHDDHDGVSNHQPHDCLRNGLFRRRSRKISKLRVTDRWISRTKGKLRRKCFHLMTSSWCVVETRAKLQSDWKTPNTHRVPLILCDILGRHIGMLLSWSLPIINTLCFPIFVNSVHVRLQGFSNLVSDGLLACRQPFRSHVKNPC